jgi:hypothetical protein
MRINGINVRDDEARTLIDLLLRQGTAHDLSAATAIETGLAGGGADVDLSNTGLRAVWQVLADQPPRGNLAQLGDYIAHAI